MSDRTSGVWYRSGAPKTRAGQQTVKEFLKRLDLESLLMKTDRASTKISVTADEALAAKLGGEGGWEGGRGGKGQTSGG